MILVDIFASIYCSYSCLVNAATNLQSLIQIIFATTTECNQSGKELLQSTYQDKLDIERYWKIHFTQGHNVFFVALHYAMLLYVQHATDQAMIHVYKIN